MKTEKENLINEINEIINEHGGFTTSDVYADHSPCVKSGGNLVHLMESFHEGGGVVYVYDPRSHSSDEIDEYDEFFEELEELELETVLELAKTWAEQNKE